MSQAMQKKSIKDRLYDSGPQGLTLGHMAKMIDILGDRNSTRYYGSIANRYSMADWIICNGDFEAAHWQLVDKYKSNQSGRATNRGRSFGATNKNKRPASTNPFDVDFTGTETVSTVETVKIENTLDIDKVFDSVKRDVTGDSATLAEFNRFQDVVNRDIWNLKQADTAIRNDMKGLEHSILVTDAAVKTCFDKINNIKLNTPTIVEIVRPNVPTLSLGLQHCNFPDFMIYCNALTIEKMHLNIWMYGPAGTGKSTAVKMASKAYNRGFRTNGKIAYAHELMGHMHGGEYISTQFREAFEQGLFYCADELDRWLPDAQVALNGALAQDYAAFPDKLVRRHPDFVFVGTANTTGQGGTLEYCAAYQPDAAFLDRNVFIDWPIDEALEDSLCYNKDWLKICRHVRAGVTRTGLKNIMITPRAVMYGQALISAGLSVAKTEIAVLKKGMTASQWQNVRGN